MSISSFVFAARRWQSPTRLHRSVWGFLLLVGLLGTGLGIAPVQADEDPAAPTVSSSDVHARSLPADGVCVFQGALVRKAPGGDGEFMTRLNAGETFRFLGKTKKADLRGKTREYSKVKLIGGKKGWVRSDMIATEAEPAAVRREAVLYERPTALAGTDASFRAMDVVAVLESKESWVKVRGVRRGENWWDEGWIRPKALTKDKTDVAVAALWKKARDKESMAERRKAIKQITENSALKGSSFIDSLTTHLDDMGSASAGAGDTKGTTTQGAAYVQDGEQSVFSFTTEDGKRLSLVRGTDGGYLTYRFGTDDEIELEYPESTDGSWSTFTYHAPSTEDAQYLSFSRGGYEYLVFAKGQPQGAELRTKVVKNGNWKVLTRSLDEKQLRGLTKRELRITRNTIFARHGHSFDTDWLGEHFSQFDWYEPTGGNVGDQLTDTEKKNVKLITQLEDNYDPPSPTDCGIKIKPPESDDVTTINCKPETAAGNLGVLQRFDQITTRDEAPSTPW